MMQQGKVDTRESVVCKRHVRVCVRVSVCVWMLVQEAAQKQSTAHVSEAAADEHQQLLQALRARRKAVADSHNMVGGWAAIPQGQAGC